MPLTRARAPISRAADLDILSAVWILSCIDENPIVTYRGITERLALPDDFDVKSLVLSRRELFRPRVTNSRLNKWKGEMKGGKNRPTWIVEIRNREEQVKAIDEIGRDDVFRNQFRSGEDAAKATLETIDWGLKHIERLKRSAADDRQEKSQRRATWISFGSLVVAALAILSSAGLQWMSMREQRELKQYEVSFRPKQEAYSTFMSAFTKASVAARVWDERNTTAELNRMESAYFLFEPFLPANKRTEIHLKFDDFVAFCNQRLRSPHPAVPLPNDFKAFDERIPLYKTYFQNELYNGLFD